jgi:general secretion pathway protein F
MMRYRYVALASQGTTERGTIQAVSADAALAGLRARQLTPISLNQQHRLLKLQLMPAPWLRQSTLGTRERAEFTQELAVLLTAGLTIDDALTVLATGSRNDFARRLYESLATAVRSGRSLSAAMGMHPQEFPPDYLTMVTAGEGTGTLPEVLRKLFTYLDRSEQLRSRLRSALVYPAILATMILFTMFIVIAVVLPRFEQLFTDAGASLPWPTQVVLTFGRLAAAWGPWLMLGGAAATVGFASFMRSPKRRAQLDQWILGRRVMLGLQVSIPLARFLRALSTLVGSGVPVPEAMGVAVKTFANRALRAKGIAAQERVQGGHLLSVALQGARVFPDSVIRFVHVGEHGGQLGQMLEYSADAMDRDISRKLDRLLALVVPVITIGMGLLVAGLISSVLVGVLSVNDLAY